MAKAFSINEKPYRYVELIVNELDDIPKIYEYLTTHSYVSITITVNAGNSAEIRKQFISCFQRCKQRLLTTYVHFNQVDRSVQNIILKSKVFYGCLKYISNSSFDTTDLTFKLLMTNCHIRGYLLYQHFNFSLPNNFVKKFKNFTTTKLNMTYNDGLFAVYIHSQEINLVLYNILQDKDIYKIFKICYCNLLYCNETIDYDKLEYQDNLL
ncbi:hypothetical protein [Neodiprion abietis nucleopolyhedrovirus]|uniref:Uncharacterized protein n=1 Tax=Neodiprion abietis nucleopolyhedrovirus TaxID=204507 RepID=Q0ZP02_9CBAC|nr:hypothetical protein [Neodiprion abietis nucleopolyhedrovirus]ABC74952.1 unknown [Neodiprion abietis nucleopolyhedrovirus]